MSYHAVSGLGADACPPCTFMFGSDCLACPDGADDIPGCEGCVDGHVTAATSSPPVAFTDTFWGAVSIGVATTLAVSVASAYLMKKMKV